VAQHGLADAYRSAGQCGAAIPIYRTAIALGPHKSESYVGLAFCSAEIGRMSDARVALGDGVAALPGDADLKLRLAALEERTFRNFDEAVRLCREARAIDKTSVQASQCVQRLEERAV